jgi:hypothetical protein
VSFGLTEDRLELQRWVHEFAADVVRPAAHGFDEREDFRWPAMVGSVRPPGGPVLHRPAVRIEPCC